jgi:hypothetical protein
MNISKETRFKDLPEEIKRRLINLYAKSHERQIGLMEPVEIVSFDQLLMDVNDLQTYTLQQNLKKCISSAEYLKNCYENGEFNAAFISENVKKELATISGKIFSYNKCTNENDFLSCIKDTLMLLSGKFLKIKNDFENRRSFK